MVKSRRMLAADDHTPGGPLCAIGGVDRYGAGFDGREGGLISVKATCHRSPHLKFAKSFGDAGTMKKVSIPTIAATAAIVLAPALAWAQESYGDGYGRRMM